MILPKDSTWQENLRCTPVLYHLPSVGPKQLCASVGQNTLKSLYKMKIDMELLCPIVCYISGSKMIYTETSLKLYFSSTKSISTMMQDQNQWMTLRTISAKSIQTQFTPLWYIYLPQRYLKIH